MKDPRWLTESFAQGIDERELLLFDEGVAPACWLAQFDKAERPCEGRFERFHFVPRQRVEHALGALLPEFIPCPCCLGDPACEVCAGTNLGEWCKEIADEVAHLAAWDCRNGGIACERVRLDFDPGWGPRVKLIHPKSGCQAATACGNCGMGVGDPEFPGCELCPDPKSDECWLEAWIGELTADEMFAGTIEFPVSPECDGETLTLHIAAADPDPTQQPQPKKEASP